MRGEGNKKDYKTRYGPKAWVNLKKHTFWALFGYTTDLATLASGGAALAAKTGRVAAATRTLREIEYADPAVLDTGRGLTLRLARCRRGPTRTGA